MKIVRKGGALMKNREVSKELSFIKKISKITIKKACENSNINNSNLMNNRCKKEKEKEVVKFLLKEIYSAIGDIL